MFCESCGTTVCGDSTYGIVTVAGATLDNTNGIEPRMAIFTKAAPRWALLPTDIPCFETDQIDWKYIIKSYKQTSQISYILQLN